MPVENQDIFLSVVSPVYHAEAVIDELVKQIKASAAALNKSYEILLVEDGSPDRSWQKIAENSKLHAEVRGIRLSKNFGQHAAITAGLEHSRGKYVVVMDCDLQDNPKYIPELLAAAQTQDVDIVYTVKKKREHSLVKNIFGRLYHLLFNWLVDGDSFSRADVGSYSLISRNVVEAFKRIHDQHRHYLLVLRWLGFSSTYVDINHEQRFAGESSYSLAKLMVHAFEGVTSQSNKLLWVSIKMGFLFCGLSVLTIIGLVSAYFMHGFLAGWPSLSVLILFCTGVILIMMGVLGIYVGNIFDQTRQRPLYLVARKTNFGTEQH